MDDTFVDQFSENIKFNYTCFDRVIIFRNSTQIRYELKKLIVRGNEVRQTLAQPSLLEEGYDLIQQGLSRNTQELALNIQCLHFALQYES